MSQALLVSNVVTRNDNVSIFSIRWSCCLLRQEGRSVFLATVYRSLTSFASCRTDGWINECIVILFVKKWVGKWGIAFIPSYSFSCFALELGQNIRQWQKHRFWSMTNTIWHSCIRQIPFHVLCIHSEIATGPRSALLQHTSVLQICFLAVFSSLCKHSKHLCQRRWRQRRKMT